MTREDAEKIGEAVADGGGYADKDVAIEIFKLLSEAGLGWTWHYDWGMENPIVTEALPPLVPLPKM